MPRHHQLEAQLAHADERAAAARPAASNAAAVLAQEQQVLAAIVKVRDHLGFRVGVSLEALGAQIASQCEWNLVS